jgi:signal transduction histidine kinase
MFSKSRKPSRRLLLLILGTTVAPLATLLWVGWNLLEQDRELETHQVQQRVERAADLVVPAIQRALAVSEQRLGTAYDWPDGAVAVTFQRDSIDAVPAGRLAYLPKTDPLPEAPASVFERADELEFRNQDRTGTIAALRELSKTSDKAIRGEALKRLGGILAASGQTEEALAAYAQLATFDGVSSAGHPLGLIGQWARCDLLRKSQRTELQAEAQQLANDLASGKWRLDSAVYALYAADAAKWSGAAPPGTRWSEVFAEAVTQLWERRHSIPASHYDSLAVGPHNLTVAWQTSGETVRALIASEEFVQTQWMAAAKQVAHDHGVVIHLIEPSPGGAIGVKRSAADSVLPWNIIVTSVDPPPERADFVQRRRFLIAGFVVLAATAVTACYLIVRAVSREIAVARLQSDFVAAVSHEFRTPLTALRQFTDMLRDNERVSSESGKERRLLCYDAQSRATDRLTKLVESLLDFGRMEAGARRYHFEPHDCGALVGRVVEDFRQEIHSSGYCVGFHRNGPALVDADSEALGRAIWNLLDNAVKYSPEHRDVEAAVERQNGCVRIAIRDHGIGIPANDRSDIFSKFKRGEQARKRGIKGTGIGLAIVDEIVKAHHGRVEVESELDKGSTFTIVLPVKD